METRSAENYSKYKRQRNKTTHTIRLARRKFEDKLINDMKSEPKKLFQYVRSQQKVKPTISSLEYGDRLTETDSETAEELQRFFQSVFVKESDGALPVFPELVEPEEVTTSVIFSPEDVSTELRRLKIGKAAGPDGIPSILLRECATQLAFPLHCLFKKTLNSSVLPSDWRKARITPIYKKGSRVKAGNYRPVSLTSQVCKVLERIIRKKIMVHLTSNNLLSAQQHGFLQKKSCQTNLLETLEDWTKTNDEGHPLDAIFLDYQKAFDSVPHRRLLKKLHSYGIQGDLVNWVKAFLSERSQQVVVGTGQSRWGSVMSGVPQGSVLGPVLFLVYVNELPSVIQSSAKLFADDTKVYRPIQSANDVKILQDDLIALEKWSDDWLLKFNASKCKVMHCGSSNPKAEYCMTGADGHMSKLGETVLEKDLGMHISNTLKPTAHCSKAAGKANSALRLLRNSFSSLNERNFTVLFTTYVRPHLDYCLQAVGPYMVQDFKALEKVQRRATRLVTQIRHLPYQDRLKKLKLLSIEDRALRGDLIETYKILTGKLNVDRERFFEVNDDDRLRGHHLKLKKRRSNGVLRSKFFSNRVVTHWNKLPCDVVSARTTNAFKNRIDQHWATVTMPSSRR